jgi:hypothetical protein
MHFQKMIILICVIVGCLALFLPWFDLPVVGNIDGIKVSYSWIGAALYVICLFPVLSGNKMSKISSGNRWVRIAGLSGALYGFFKWYVYRNDIEEMGDGNFVARAISDSVSIQYGLILFIAAGLVIFFVGSRK